CGNGTTWKLGMVGVDYLNVDHIFITHFHPDHTADLIPFLFATKYPHPTRSREKPLVIWGPKGFIDFYSSLKTTYHDWIAPDMLTVKEINEEPVGLDDFVLIAGDTFHTENSIAYRVESNGKSLVYSGDTGYTEKLIELAMDVDLLLIECSFPDELKFHAHLTPSEVGKIGRASRAKKIILTHLYADCDEIDIVAQVREHVDAEVILAEDLMEIDI
ncbi:MAG TPA: ribonuclease Z, partial [Thermodesulfobacteriota bacterium]|nr:ribonuclease Z [Thermodesulfobacteriota bacterium]